MSDKGKNDNDENNAEAENKFNNSIGASECIIIDNNTQTIEGSQQDSSNDKLEEEKNEDINKDHEDVNDNVKEVEKNVNIDAEKIGESIVENDEKEKKFRKEDEMDVEKEDTKEGEKDKEQLTENTVIPQSNNDGEKDHVAFDKKGNGKMDGRDPTKDNEKANEMAIEKSRELDDDLVEIISVVPKSQDAGKKKDDGYNIGFKDKDESFRKSSNFELIVIDHSIKSASNKTTRYDRQNKKSNITNYSSAKEINELHKSSCSQYSRKSVPVVLSGKTVSDETSVIKSRCLIHVLRRLCESANPRKKVLKALHRMFVLLESLILIIAKKKRFPSTTSPKKLINDNLEEEKEWPAVMEEALSQMEPIIFDASTMSVPLYYIHPEERNEQIDIWIQFFIHVTSELFNKRKPAKSSRAQTKNTTVSTNSNITPSKRLNSFLGRWNELKKDVEICRQHEHVEYLKVQNNVFAMNTSITKLMCDDIRSEIRSQLSRFQKQTKLLLSSRRRQQQNTKPSSSSISNNNAKHKSCFVNKKDIEDQLDSIMNAEQKLKEFRKILSISYNCPTPTSDNNFQNKNSHKIQLTNKRRLSSIPTTTAELPSSSNCSTKKRKLVSKEVFPKDTSLQTGNASTDVYGNRDNNESDDHDPEATIDDEEKELMTLFELDEVDMDASDIDDEDKDNENNDGGEISTDDIEEEEKKNKSNISQKEMNRTSASSAQIISPMISKMMESRIHKRLLEYMKSKDEMRIYLALLSYRSIAHFSSKEEVDYWMSSSEEDEEQPSGIFKFILKIMETIPAVQVQEQAMAALCSITSHDENNLKKLIDLGANKIFTASVENHIDSKEIEEASQNFIHKVTTSAINQQQDEENKIAQKEKQTNDDSEKNDKDGNEHQEKNIVPVLLKKSDDSQGAVGMGSPKQEESKSTRKRRLETNYFSELVFRSVNLMDEYKCYLACMGFRFISHFSSEERRYITSQNGISLLSIISKTFVHSTRVQEQAMASLCNLALDKENRLNIVREGIPRAVTDTLERNRDCNALQLVGCGLLKNISNDLKDCSMIADSIVDADGILSMIEAIENNMECPILIKFACDTLMNLASFRDSERLSINRSGGKRLLKGLKPKYKKTSQDLYHVICCVMKALEKGKRTIKK